MKSVLISIRPKWCEMIARGNKTIEVRRTRPDLRTPFKCYIYCTQGNTLYRSKADGAVRLYRKKAHETFQHHTVMNGKVIGEFVCDRIDPYLVCRGSYKRIDVLSSVMYNPVDYNSMCLTEKEFADYGAGKTVLGWHISELKIYDELKELSVFRGPCPEDLYCESCGMYRVNTEGCGNAALKFSRPPQSWRYVED